MEVELSNLLGSDGAAVTGALAQCTVYQSDGITEIAGVSWPLTMNEANGIYTAPLPSGLAITPGQLYYVRVQASYGGADFDAQSQAEAIRRTA